MSESTDQRAARETSAERAWREIAEHLGIADLERRNRELEALLAESLAHLWLAPLEHYRWCEGTTACDCPCRNWADKRLKLSSRFDAALAARSEERAGEGSKG